MRSAERGFRGAHSSVPMCLIKHWSALHISTACTRLGCSCITYIFIGQSFEVFGDCVVYMKKKLRIKWID